MAAALTAITRLSSPLSLIGMGSDARPRDFSSGAGPSRKLGPAPLAHDGRERAEPARWIPPSKTIGGLSQRTELVSMLRRELVSAGGRRRRLGGERVGRPRFVDLKAPATGPVDVVGPLSP